MSHVLFISHARGLHGAEAVMVQAAKACHARGARVTVVVPSVGPDEGLAAALDGMDVQQLALPYRSAGVHAWRNALVRVYNLYALIRLCAYARRERADRIYSSSSVTLLGADLARCTGIRHCWHWHEPVDILFGWHPSMKNMYRRLALRTERIICISQQQKREWEQSLGIALPNAEIIYNPIKPIIPVSSGKNDAHEGVRIGFIGHFEERKNLPLLVHTFERLYAHYPSASLRLCGAKGEADRQAVMHMTDLCEPVLTVLDHSPEVVAFYHSIDILVLPSRKETMPLVVLEAMQAGVCVLQTDRSGMSELTEDGKETLFFSPDEADSLLSLLTLCMDKDYRTRIAQAGQKKAMQLIKNSSFDEQISLLLCE